MNFQNKGIKAKLGFLVLGATAALGGYATYSVRTVSEMKEAVEFLGHQRIPLTEAKGDLLEDTQEVPRYAWRTLSTPPASDARRSSLKKLEEAVTQIQASYDRISTFQIGPE